jgi:hypothetical protein
MKFRAALYKNEGQGVRLLMEYSDVVDSAEVAMKLAEDMKLDRPKPEFWVAVVSEKTCPHAFP